MKKIVVSGVNNSGKSTSIKLFFKKLLDSFDEETKVKFFRYGQKQFWNASVHEILAEWPNVKDFVAVFRIDQKTVMGITSFGDSVSLLEDSLNIFESFECTYAVLACRSEVSSTYKYIQEQLNNVEPLILKTPTSDSQKLAQNKDDGRVAEEIHKKIFRI